MKIPAPEDPSAAFEAHAQIVIGVDRARDLTRRKDLDLKLEDRLRGGIHETAVTVFEYLKKLRAVRADENRHRADLDNHLIPDSALRVAAHTLFPAQEIPSNEIPSRDRKGEVTRCFAGLTFSLTE